jgi:uncharacterized membrane protein
MGPILPANVHMAVNAKDVAAHGVPADRIPAPLPWARLPIQALLALWIWRATAG